MPQHLFLSRSNKPCFRNITSFYPGTQIKMKFLKLHFILFSDSMYFVVNENVYFCLIELMKILREVFCGFCDFVKDSDFTFNDGGAKI